MGTTTRARLPRLAATRRRLQGLIAGICVYACAVRAALYTHQPAVGRGARDADRRAASDSADEHPGAMTSVRDGRRAWLRSRRPARDPRAHMAIPAPSPTARIWPPTAPAIVSRPHPQCTRSLFSASTPSSDTRQPLTMGLFSTDPEKKEEKILQRGESPLRTPPARPPCPRCPVLTVLAAHHPCQHRPLTSRGEAR